MNLREISYFKPLCLLVAALFTSQCFYMERKLISTEEKVIEEGNHEYVYELERIKTPSEQDPTVEYRIVKFPAKRIELINTYQKIKKVNPLGAILGGCLAGALVGGIIFLKSGSDAQSDDEGVTIFRGLVAGGLIGLSAASINKSAQKVEVKIPESHFQKKSDSVPVAVPHNPLEIKLGIRGLRSRKLNAFQTKTDDQGLVRINLITDLKMTKFLPGDNLILYIYYLNQESQLKGILRDSPGW